MPLGKVPFGQALRGVAHGSSEHWCLSGFVGHQLRDPEGQRTVGTEQFGEGAGPFAEEAAWQSAGCGTCSWSWYSLLQIGGWTLWSQGGECERE